MRVHVGRARNCPRLAARLKRLHEHFCYLDEQIKAPDKEMDGQLPLTIWAAA